MTQEGSTDATILVYGYIGEEYSYGANGWEMTGNTDTDFIKEIDRLSESYSRINVRINSPGGEVYHGLPIISAMQRCKAEVHTYIDGMACSMAGVIWLAGKHRHMAKNGMLMLHAGSNICWGNAKDMRETADVLDQFTKTLAMAIADSTGQPLEDIMGKYFSDYADHWLTHEDVAATGWITDAEEYTAADDAMPKAAATMSYKDLIAFFKEKETPKGQSIMEQVKSAFAELRAAIIPPTPTPVIQSPTNNQDMTLEEFKAALADNTLKLDDVTAHLASLTPAPVALAEDAAIASLKAELAALRAEVKAFGEAPAAQRSTPGLPETDLPVDDGALTAAQRYEAKNKELNAAVNSRETASFVMQ